MPEITDKDLTDLNRWIDNLENELTKIKSNLASFNPEVDGDAIDRYSRLMIALYNEGVTFTKARFYEVAVECGYTKQGAAGFFAWRKAGGDSPLVVIGDGTYVALAEWVVPWLRAKGHI